LRGVEPVSLAVTVLAAAAGALLIVGEFMSIAWVDVAQRSCEVINDSNPSLADRCSLSGFERHGGALALLGVLAIVMGWGAGLGRSRPAAVALLVAGAIALGISLISDLPETSEAGAIGQSFEGAEGRRGTGLYLDLAGGALALLAGGLGLARTGKPPP